MKFPPAQVQKNFESSFLDLAGEDMAGDANILLMETLA